MTDRLNSILTGAASGNSRASRDIAYHLHPFTNPTSLASSGPHIVSYGEGIYVKDETGKKYYEGMSGLWCASLGFSEKLLVEAALEQFKKLPFYHSFTGKTVEPAADLAEILISNAPVFSDSPMSKVFFANSGSEANDTAVKMIWFYNAAQGRPEKRKIISRKRGYHGVTIVGASLTGLSYAQEGFGLPLDFVKHTMAPDFYNECKPGETSKEFVFRCATELETLILKEGPDTVAAFFAEPVMGAGGVIIPPEGYYESIHEVLQKYDVLFVSDEVICGFGRTGNMWGADSFNVRPDILTCAKALSSAYLPISAVMVSDKVYKPIVEHSDKLSLFGHGFTYSAHPVCAAVALRAQQLMKERDIIGHVRRCAPKFSERVDRLAKYDFVGHARAIGLIGAVELVANKPIKKKFEPNLKIAANLVAVCQEYGVILRALPGDIIGFCPPLIINDKELDDLFDRVEAAFDDFSRSISRYR